MAKFYVWKKGDHICDVAKKFNLTCKQLIEMNHIENIDYIKEGHILRIEDRIVRKED